MTDLSSHTTMCFHCTLPIPKNVHLLVTIENQLRPMCCAGCQAVAQTIVDSGLADYYKHRDVAAIRPDSLEDLIPESLRDEMVFYDHPEISKQFVVTNVDHTAEAFLVMEGIVCAACVWLLERGIRKIEGVQTFQINYSSHRAHLSFDPNIVKLSTVLLQVRELGYKAIPFDEHESQKHLKAQRSLLLKQFAVAAISSMQVMMLAVGLYFGVYEGMSDESRLILRWANLVLSLPCITYASWSFYRSAWLDLLNMRLSMDVNISLAIILGALASIWNTWFDVGEIYFESVTMFAFLLLGARLIEMNARHKAMSLADSVLRIKPRFANRLNAEGHPEVVSLTDLKVDDLLLVKPGETIPTDGVLLSDIAELDESLLTGESLPVRKKYQDSVIGGALNIDQTIRMRVSVLGAETVFSQMIRLIDRAMSEKPKIAQVADQISNWFVILLLITCGISYVVWRMIDPSRAFEVMLAILVVSCPCALALATPAALTAGSQVLVSLGLLPTRAGSLENLSRVTDIVFDKTGTLTNGQFHISTCLDATGNALSVTQADALLRIASAMERESHHPIARAFTNTESKAAIVNEEITVPLPVLETKQILGQGVSAVITEGAMGSDYYQLGKLNWIQADFQKSAALIEAMAQTEISTWVTFAKNGQVLAFFGLSDQLRADAVATLKQLKKQYTVHIVSGDNEEAVQRLNQQCDFDHVRFECLPEDKLNYVAALQAQNKVVAMLGDGLNDAPVLAQADVSIAMNQGAQLAQTTADMILLSDRLAPLLGGLVTAKETQRIIQQNLIWALIYNVIALPVAAMGFVVPWIAALGMSASSLIVIGNTLRLRK